jgi:chemotaxis response regulator CheB
MTAKKKQAARPAQKKRPKSSRARNSTFPLENKQKNFLIVGIGASAGGLKAFEHFFSKRRRKRGRESFQFLISGQLACPALVLFTLTA